MEEILAPHNYGESTIIYRVFYTSPVVFSPYFWLPSTVPAIFLDPSFLVTSQGSRRASCACHRQGKCRARQVRSKKVRDNEFPVTVGCDFFPRKLYLLWEKKKKQQKKHGFSYLGLSIFEAPVFAKHEKHGRNRNHSPAQSFKSWFWIEEKLVVHHVKHYQHLSISP